MNIHHATSDLARIREQLNRTHAYQNFRSSAVAISAFLVLLACLIQIGWISQPLENPIAYLGCWLSVAAISLAIAGGEMLYRERKTENRLVKMTHVGLSLKISPALLGGSIVTALITLQTLENPTANLFWSLPGIWALFYSVGLFSCHQHLPRINRVAAFVFTGGCGLLIHGWLTHELGAWQMLFPFGLGQAFLSITLAQSETPPEATLTTSSNNQGIVK